MPALRSGERPRRGTPDLPLDTVHDTVWRRGDRVGQLLVIESASAPACAAVARRNPALSRDVMTGLADIKSYVGVSSGGTRIPADREKGLAAPTGTSR
jgi:hypothetical protein